MGLFLKLFGIVKYLLNFLKSSDFLKPIVEEYKLLEVTPLDLNFAVLIVKRLH